VKSELQHDEVDDVFKGGEFQLYGLDLKKELLHPAMTSVKLERRMDMRALGTRIEGIYATLSSPRREQQYNPYYRRYEWVMKEADQGPITNFSLLLLGILPPSTSSSYTNSSSLLCLLERILGRNLHRVELTETLPSAWDKAYRIGCNMLVEKISNCNSAANFPRAVHDSEEGICGFLNSTHETLKALRHPMGEAKIFLNELGELKKTRELKMAAQPIDELLKRAYRVLKNGKEDFKVILMDPGLKHQLDAKLTVAEVCTDIDKLIEELRKNMGQCPNRAECKAVITELYTKYIEPQDGQGEKMFPLLWKHKDKIVCGFILDKVGISVASKVASLGPDIVQALSQDVDLISTMRKRRDALAKEIGDLEAFKAKLSEAKQETEKAQTEATRMQGEAQRLTQEVTTLQAQYGQTRNEVARWQQKKTKYESQWSIVKSLFADDSQEGRRIGYRAEAFAYEALRRSGEYCEVIWPNLSKNGQGFLVEFGGKEYVVDETGNHYDLIAKKNDGSVHVFEVKSTVNDVMAQKYPFWVSPSQWQMLSQPSSKGSSKNLVFVFNSRSNSPQAFWMKVARYTK
jgi:hypothetical protein